MGSLDCYDVYAPTVPMCELKLLLAVAATRDIELFHMDATTAFISAELNLKTGEVIYDNPRWSRDQWLTAHM